jgi:pimeloyl-ACP methyl ester carboxylesterase
MVMDSSIARRTRLVDGTLLHWAEAGAGRPLILLHGLSDSHRTWHHVVRTMSATHRVLMLDLPGHGLSGRPDASYSLEWHAHIIGRWIDILGLEDIDLVGHSYGGGVAQFMLLSHADRVRRLGLVAAGGMGREVALGLRLLSLPGVDRVIQPFLGIGTRFSLRAIGAHTNDERRWQARANSAPGTARALVRTIRGVIDIRGQTRHFLEHAQEVSRLPPIAVYWGERDPIIPVAHAHRAVTHLTGARLRTFPNCGHFPHLEQPKQFLPALAAFLEDSDARRARLVVDVEPLAQSGWLRSGIAAFGERLRRLWRGAPSSPA